MKEIKYKTASTCVVLINPEGLVLGVSRKDNHQDFGLVGGRMDPEDNDDFMITAIRETKEETGLDIYDLQLVFAIHKNGNMGYTYLAKYTGEINHNEPHIVKWMPFDILIRGSFGKYNQLVSESLDDMGIKYQKGVDMNALTNDIKQYLANNIRKGYIAQFKLNFIDEDGTIHLDGDYEEAWDDYDVPFVNGLKEIGNKHFLSVRFPYWYMSK